MQDRIFEQNADKINFIVPDNCDGITVHTFLQRECGMSTRLLRRLKRVQNGITADGIAVRSIDVLRAGQAVVLTLPKDNVRITECDIPLSVVYEDEHLIVINKPPYIAVHPGGEQHPAPTLAQAVVAHYINNGRACSFRPAGRLDRNTSGLLIAAKNAYAAYRLNNGIQKEYLAVVSGRLEGNGRIEQPIRVRDGYGITREVGEGGKSCITLWESLSASDCMSLIRLKPLTGRTHQLRVHMAWMGHPLAGDTMYGGTADLIDRHALHCSEAVFEHPCSGEHMALSAPPPDDMTELIQRLVLRYV